MPVILINCAGPHGPRPSKSHQTGPQNGHLCARRARSMRTSIWRYSSSKCLSSPPSIIRSLLLPAAKGLALGPDPCGGNRGCRMLRASPAREPAKARRSLTPDTFAVALGLNQDLGRGAQCRSCCRRRRPYPRPLWICAARTASESPGRSHEGRRSPRPRTPDLGLRPASGPAA
jgi:hypothetical protein